MEVNRSWLQQELREHVRDLQSRCLFKASKWITGLLIGLTVQRDPKTQDRKLRIMEDLENDLVGNELDLISYAQSLITNGEYQRCFHFLLSTDNAGEEIEKRVKSSYGLFLAYYSMYMAGEKIRDQQLQEAIALDSPSSAIQQNKQETNANDHISANSTIKNRFFSSANKNPFLPELYEELTRLYNLGKVQSDSYLLYLFAVTIRDLGKQYGSPSKQYENAKSIFRLSSSSPSKDVLSHIDLFRSSLQLNPYNWSCWLEFTQCYLQDDIDTPSFEDIFNNSAVGKDQVSNRKVMYTFFYVHLSLERQLGSEALESLQLLHEIFPKSTYVLTQIAVSQYTLRDYDQAQDTFEHIRRIDPYCTDHIDIYSNILYVKELKCELSALAHNLIKINRYTPECCCVIGNYYSLKGQHERAIQYFTRALKLNSSYLSAWTLMGHECVELRNTAAAVQCYQNAVNLNKLDYRAWYGLGQTYEMLHMFSYALFYYKKATSIRSNDSRIWCAVGSCYQHLNQPQFAIQAYEYAVKYDEREGIATKELGRLYRDQNQMDKAAMCYLQHWISQGYIEAENYHVTRSMTHSSVLDSDPSMADAIVYVGSYFHSKGYLEYAEEYCSLLLDYVGPEGDQARSLLRELRSLMMKSNQSMEISDQNMNISLDSILPQSTRTSMEHSIRNRRRTNDSEFMLLSTSDDEITLRTHGQSQLMAFSISPSQTSSSTRRQSMNQSESSINSSTAMSVNNSMDESSGT